MLQIFKVTKLKIVLSFFFVMVLSLGMGNLNFKIGFSLKPYMLVTVITFFLTLPYVKIKHIGLYEKMLFIYVFVYIFTILHTEYIKEAIWYSCTFLLLSFYYLTYRRIIDFVSISYIEKTIQITGIIICICSLLYYLKGIAYFNFIPIENGIVKYGVMIDRNMFRLMGTPNEPNITPVFLSLYFFYYLYVWKKSFLNKLGFVLCFLTIALTLSRGAYLSLFLALFLAAFLSNGNLSKKICILIKYSFVVGIVLITLHLFLFYTWNIDIFAPIIDRFNDLESDGGSGRAELWHCAFQSFLDNPIYGIGLNATRAYNIQHYGVEYGNYTHNSHLEVLAESGILGFGIYAIWLITLLFKLYYLQKNNKNIKFLFTGYIAIILQMFFVSIQLTEILFFVVLLVYRYDIEIKTIHSKKLSNLEDMNI